MPCGVIMMDNTFARNIAVGATIAGCGAAIAVGSILTYNHFSSDRKGKEAKANSAGIPEHINMQDLAGTGIDRSHSVTSLSSLVDSTSRGDVFVEKWDSPGHAPLTPLPSDGDKEIYTVVLTGGPCGGKSSCLQYLSKRLREDYNIQVFVVPEMPTLFKSTCECPFPFRESKRHQMNWEGNKMHMKLEFEEAFKKIAQSSSAKTTVILCDRGVPDSAAYCGEDEFQDILDRYNWSLDKLYSRYDLIIHLETTAFDTPFYSTENNKARMETGEEAREQDRKTQVAWAAHENVIVVRNRTCYVKNSERSIFKSPMPVMPCPTTDIPDLTLTPPASPSPPSPKDSAAAGRSSFQKKKHLVLQHVLQLLSLEPCKEFQKPKLFLLSEPEKCSTANLQIHSRKLKYISVLRKIEMETTFLKATMLPNLGGATVIDRVVEKRGAPHQWRYYLAGNKYYTTPSGRKEMVLTERRIKGSQFFTLRQGSADKTKFIVNRQRTTFCVTRPDPSGDQVTVRSLTHQIDKYELRHIESLGKKMPDVTNFIILRVFVDSEKQSYTPPTFLGECEDVSDRAHKFTMAMIASGKLTNSAMKNEELLHK